jgi:suppressor of ftsI
MRFPGSTGYALQAFCVINLLLIVGTTSRSQEGPPFVNPPAVTSSGGVLNTTLTIGPATVSVAGVPFTSNVYNGLYAPPVLRVSPGDVMHLKLVNNISTNQTTNLHYHGFAVSPLPPSDNIYLKIPQSGGTYNYTVNIPSNHARGMFWYHPHTHGISEGQVLDGLSGAMIVEGFLRENYPKLVGITERLMLLKDIELNSLPTLSRTSPCYPADTEAKIKTVNGLCNPTIKIAPNEIQFWRIANIGADAYFNLQLPNIQMFVIAVDGNATKSPIQVSNYLLPPGARVEMLVIGGPPGKYQFSSIDYDTGPAGDPNPTVPLATLVSSGPAMKNLPLEKPFMSGAMGRRRVFPTIEQVLGYRITGERTFTFSENSAGDQFCINQCQYDMNRVDTTVNVGDVETWTLRNTSGEVHAFHIHQLDFAVIEINGVSQTPTGLQDTVNLPIQVGSTPGEVKIIVPFLDPTIAGKFVYHCHILEHEDAGMMANILVLPREANARKRILEQVSSGPQQHEHSKLQQQPCIPCVDKKK